MNEHDNDSYPDPPFRHRPQLGTHTGLFCKIKIASGSGVDLRFEMGVGVGGHTLLNSRFCDACLVEAT